MIKGLPRKRLDKDYTTKNRLIFTKIIRQIRNLWEKRKVKSEYSTLFILAISYIIVVFYVSLSNHLAFGSSAWDLGIYSQSLYSVLAEGKFFYNTVDLPGNPTGSFFGIHFSPILFALLPVYALYPNPATLLLLRPIIISIGAIPLYWIIRDELENKSLVLFFIIAYFLYPPVLMASLNFDLQVFLPTFFLFSIYYLKKGNLPRAFAFMIFALLVNEFVPLIVCAIGLYYALQNRRHILIDIRQKKVTKKSVFPIILILTSILWWIMATSIISCFNPTALGTKWEWGIFGQSPLEIFTTVLSNPLLAIGVMLSDGSQKFLYLSVLFGPFAFLSFLDPLTLIMAVPWLLASMLSVNPLYYSIGPQYPEFISAFIFISAINGLAKVSNLSKQMAKRITRLVVVTLVITVLAFPFGQISHLMRAPPLSNSADVIQQSIDLVPSEASISVMPHIFPHFSSKLNAYPYYQKGVEYVLIDINSWWYTVSLPRPTHTAPIWSEAEISSDYGIVLNAQGILLYKKGYTGEPIYTPMNFTLKHNDLKIGIGKTMQDMTSQSKSVLVHMRNESEGIFWRSSTLRLSPGLYKVTVKLKVSSTDFGKILLLKVITNDVINLAQREIYGYDFKESSQWQSFTLNFTIKRPTPIEISGTYVTNVTDVYLDFINILQESGRG